MSFKPSHPNQPTDEAEWTRKLWDVIQEEATYRDAHEDVFREFERLRDAVQDRDTNSMLNHAAPIYNHIASQGYQEHIHYEPLLDAVSNYCNKMPVAYWKGPPDQFSRSSSPNLDAMTSLSPKVSPTIALNTGPSEEKGKAKTAAISEEVARSDRDESEEECAKPRNPLPIVDGMERNLRKCTLCEQRSHSCYVNSKATRPTAACFECYHWRVKCSFAPVRAKRGEVTAERNDKQEEVAVLTNKRRKKPTQAGAV